MTEPVYFRCPKAIHEVIKLLVAHHIYRNRTEFIIEAIRQLASSFNLLRYNATNQVPYYTRAETEELHAKLKKLRDLNQKAQAELQELLDYE